MENGIKKKYILILVMSLLIVGGIAVWLLLKNNISFEENEEFMSAQKEGVHKTYTNEEIKELLEEAYKEVENE